MLFVISGHQRACSRVIWWFFSAASNIHESTFDHTSPIGFQNENFKLEMNFLRLLHPLTSENCRETLQKKSSSDEFKPFALDAATCRHRFFHKFLINVSR